MTKFYYLLPTYCALIAILTVLITYFCLWRQLKKSKNLIIQSLGKKLETEEAQIAMNDILEIKLEELMNNLRNQIPMGSMLLTPALTGKIKEVAKEEIVKMLPDLKERLMNRLTSSLHIESILWPMLKIECFKVMMYTAILGFVLGFLWLWVE